MPGADHGCQGTFPLSLVEFSICEGTERPPPGATDRGRHRLLAGQVAGVRSLLLVDSGHCQRLVDSALTVTAAGQGPRLGQGIGAIVDVAELDQPVGELLDWRV